jgi:rSAM/selenodomain-associated transferase 1
MSGPGARAQIAVFARAPVPGAAKTRLAPRLGAEGAARLQAWLTRRALARAQAVPAAVVSLYTAGDPSHPFWPQCEAEFGVERHEQRGADLGERMAGAFATLAARGAPTLLIGTDAPGQTVEDLSDALHAMTHADAVLQPALDGGYVLIGLARPQPGLFEGIAWGSAQVLAQTRACAAALRLALAELRPCADLDLPADLDAACAAGWLNAEAWQ